MPPKWEAFFIDISVSPGFEPCYPDSQSGTLPHKLETPYYILKACVFKDNLIGFEPIPPESKSSMLPLHHRLKMQI